MNLIPKIPIYGLLLITISCGVNKQKSKSDFIKSDEVAFIELYQTIDGEVISGTAPQGRRIDGPTYRYDRTIQQLDILRKADFSLDTIKAIIGNGRILKGVTGTGLSNRVTGVRKFPYSINNVTFLDINSNGLILNVDKKELILKEGEQYEDSSVSIDTIKTEPQTIIKNRITFTVHYFGKLSKSSIKQ